MAATLLCLVGLYRLEYCYDLTDTAEMKEIIREDLVSISGFPYHGEVDVLETATVKDRMFVLYRLEQNGTFERQGIYQFQRGLFGGYRFRSREYDTCPIVNTSLIQIGRQRYLEIYTANWPKEAASFRYFPGTVRLLMTARRRSCRTSAHWRRCMRERRPRVSFR